MADKFAEQKAVGPRIMIAKRDRTVHDRESRRILATARLMVSFTV